MGCTLAVMKRESEKPPQVPTYSYLLLAFGLAAIGVACFQAAATGVKEKDMDVDYGMPGLSAAIAIVLLLAWAVSQVIHYRATNRWYAAKSRPSKSPAHDVGCHESQRG